MADYARETTATTLAGVPDPLGTALRERIASSQLTVPADAPAWVTHSRRLRRVGVLGRLAGGDRDREHLTALVIGPRDVLAGTHGEVRGTAVLHARLEDVEVGALAEQFGALGAQLADDGVSITGFPVSSEGRTERGSYFVGLGPPDGEAARAALRAAVEAAKAR